jgi:pyridinium-3,5-bisthiocarboxylic acid mononucleotide nickel chelatase
MKSAYFDCASGIAGDMTLAALIHAGADVAELTRQLKTLGLDFQLKVETIQRSGITANQVKIECDEDQPHRHFSHIVKMIENSGISKASKQTAVDVFRRLGEAEAGIHGMSLEKVHFHEVGAIDSIIDVVGAVLALELLGIEAVYTSPITIGTGTTNIDHGTVLVPVPATAKLLQGIPVRQSTIEAELVTPTGAALVATLSQGLPPNQNFVTEALGYGAGTRENPGLPNLLRVRIGQVLETPGHDNIMLLETNIDDMNQEIYPWVIERLLENGALDAYITPIIGKKGRPAHILSVMCQEDAVQQHTATIFQETTTVGIRIIPVERATLPREHVVIDTEYGSIEAKKILCDGADRLTPEFEDCRRVALEKSLPLAAVYAAVHRAADRDAS